MLFYSGNVFPKINRHCRYCCFKCLPQNTFAAGINLAANHRKKRLNWRGVWRTYTYPAKAIKVR